MVRIRFSLGYTQKPEENAEFFDGAHALRDSMPKGRDALLCAIDPFNNRFSLVCESYEIEQLREKVRARGLEIFKEEKLR